MITPTAWSSCWRKSSLTHVRAHSSLQQLKQRCPASRAGKAVTLSYHFVVQARLPPSTQSLLLLLVWGVNGAPFLTEASVNWALETSTLVCAEWTIRPGWGEQITLLFDSLVCCKDLPADTDTLILTGLNTSNGEPAPYIWLRTNFLPFAQAPSSPHHPPVPPSPLHGPMPAAGRVSCWPGSEHAMSCTCAETVKHWKRVSLYRQEHECRFPDS